MVMRISGLDGVDDLADDFKAMSNRAKRLRPVGPAVHGELLLHHRKMLTYRPIGRMSRLGPSIVEASHGEHVFQASDDGFEFGTSVPYASAYEKETDRIIVECDDETGDRCAGQMANYILTGEVANVA